MLIQQNLDAIILHVVAIIVDDISLYAGKHLGDFALEPLPSVFNYTWYVWLCSSVLMGKFVAIFSPKPLECVIDDIIVDNGAKTMAR